MHDLDLRIVKLPVVKELTTLSTASIYRFMKNGTFPKQIKLGKRSSGWFLEEIYNWLEEKKNTRDGGNL
jgi:prophage regulatory protein